MVNGTVLTLEHVMQRLEIIENEIATIELIENFLFGSENKDRRTSHNDKVDELTHGQTEKRQAKKRGGNWERERE